MLTPQYPPMVGGVPILAHSAATVLADAGEDVEILTPGSEESQGTTDSPQPGLVVRRFRGGRMPGTSVLLYAVHVLRHIRSRRPDVVFCAVGWPFILTAFLIHVPTRIPYAAYFHSEELAAPERSQPARWLLRVGARYCGILMANSEFTGHRVQTLVHKPVICVPPGIDLDNRAARSTDIDVRRRYDLGQSWVLLTVARLVRRKGQDTVIRALPTVLSHVPNLHYVIVGTGPAESDLRQLAAQVGVQDKVVFAGSVPDHELAAYYRACNVFVMPTRYNPDDGEVEGFGMAFLEAGLARKPVVAGRAGGAAEAVVDGETGLLVDPLDVDAVERAIHVLLDDQDLARRLGEAGSQRVRTLFSQAAFGARLRSTLADLATDKAH